MGSEMCIRDSQGVGWMQAPVYVLESAGQDAEGNEIYQRDPLRSDFLFLCVFHDEDFVADLAALPYVTIERNMTMQECMADYPDHAQHRTSFPHIAE